MKILENLKNKDWVFWAEWVGTLSLMLGAILTAYDIVPLNKILSFFGNFVWGIVAWKWQKPSLIVISVILSVIYISGYFLGIST